MDDTERQPWSVLAECAECEWTFQEHEFQTQRVDRTDSRIDVSARQAMLHSRATGHEVQSVDAETAESGDKNQTQPSDAAPVELAGVLDAIASLSVTAQSMAARLDEDAETRDALLGYLEEMEDSANDVRQRILRTRGDG